jgi:hypothetical protein
LHGIPGIVHEGRLQVAPAGLHLSGILIEQDDVLQAAAFAVPHPRLGEEPERAEAYNSLGYFAGRQRQPQQASTDLGRRTAKLSSPCVAQLLEFHCLELIQPRVELPSLRHQPAIRHERMPSTFSLAMVWPFFRSPLSAARTVCGIVMSMRHRELPVEGVQFHPESVLTQCGHRLLANWMGEAGRPPSPARVDELERATAQLQRAAAAS